MIHQINNILKNFYKLIEEYEIDKKNHKLFLDKSIVFINELTLFFKEKTEDIRAIWNNIEIYYAISIERKEKIEKYQNYIDKEIISMKNELAFFESEMKTNMPEFKTIFSSRKKISHIAQSILKNANENIEYFKEIYLLWEKAELDKDDTYYILNSINGDIDFFMNLKIKNYQDFKNEKEKYLEKNIKIIDQVCHDIIGRTL